MDDYLAQVKTFRLDELVDASLHIDREKFPLRYQAIMNELKQRRGPEQTEPVEKPASLQSAKQKQKQKQKQKHSSPESIAIAVFLFVFFGLVSALFALWSYYPDSYPGGGALLGKVLGAALVLMSLFVASIAYWLSKKLLFLSKKGNQQDGTDKK